MNRKLLAAAAILAAVALAAWLGFSDGREHRQADPAASSAG